MLSFLFSLMSWVRLVVFCITFFFLYPLHPTVLFLCILKKSANLWFSFFFQRVQKETSGMKWVDWDTRQSLFTKLNIHYKAGPSCTRKIHYYRLFDRTIMQPIKLCNFRMMNRSIENFENFQKQSPGDILWKKMFSNNLQNSQEIHRLQACNFTRKETPTQVFSCEFCEIFKNIFFMEHLRWLLLNLRILNFRLFIFLNMTNWIC